MEISTGLLRVNASGVGMTQARRSVLPVRERLAYKIRGYGLEIASKPTGDRSSINSTIGLLKTAPVRAVGLSPIGDNIVEQVGVQNAVTHPATLAFLTHTVEIETATTVGTYVALRSTVGPWVSVQGGYLTPALYAEVILAQIGDLVNDSIMLWTIHYDAIQMSPISLAALATARGWDADVDQSEFEETPETVEV